MLVQNAMLVVLPISPPALCVVSLEKNAMLVKNALVVVLLHFPTCSVSGVAWKNCNVGEKCHVNDFALPHIPNCSVSGVAWKKCHVSEKCHVSGFGLYPHLLCAWCRLKKMPC